MPPLIPRIKTYLDNNASQWIPVRLLHSLARGKGYQYDNIQQALSTIAHTPPYACISVQESDVQRIREPGITSAGVYYKRHRMSVRELKITQDALAYFESLP